MQSPSQQPTATTQIPTGDLRVLLAILIAAAALFHLGSALAGHSLYRDQHLGAALHYAKTHIDLPHTIIVGFNATNTPTIQEFPAWQAAAGLAFKVLGPWQGWGNLTSLLLFFTCLFPLARIFGIYLGKIGRAHV